MTALVIKNGMLISMDAAIGDLQQADLLIENDRIKAIAPSLATPDGAEVLDAFGMIVMPGLVNAHMHCWQTGLRGIASDWTLQEYFRAMHAGLAGFFTPEDVHIATLAGALNQLNSGTTLLVDWCHNNPTPAHTDAAIDALQAAGIRALFLHGSPKPDPGPGQPHFSTIPLPKDEILRLRKGRLSQDDQLVTLGLAVLGPQMGIYDVCLADFSLAKSLDLLTSMHVSGPMLTEDGFERLADQGLLSPKTNIVHGNSLSDERLRLLLDHGVQFTVTAEVEMQMGFGRPLTDRLWRHKAPISIGADIESLASGDMFAIGRITLQAARLIDGLYSLEQGSAASSLRIACKDALRWLTIEGARMAGMDHRVGSLTPGKQADIILLRLSDSNLLPLDRPESSILLHAHGGNVDTVIVNGKVAKRDGRLLDVNLQEIGSALGRSGRRIAGLFSRSFSGGPTRSARESVSTHS